MRRPAGVVAAILGFTSFAFTHLDQSPFINLAPE
jgi:hypothetical protein